MPHFTSVSLLFYWNVLLVAALCGSTVEHFAEETHFFEKEKIEKYKNVSLPVCVLVSHDLTQSSNFIFRISLLIALDK